MFDLLTGPQVLEQVEACGVKGSEPLKCFFEKGSDPLTEKGSDPLTLRLAARLPLLSLITPHSSPCNTVSLG